MYGLSKATAVLDALRRTLYLFFCVNVHEHAWVSAGYGVWGMETCLERFGTFGLGGRAGRVCAVCASQIGFRVRSLSAYASLCSSFDRSSEWMQYHRIRMSLNRVENRSCEC
jgi:hypothetical protein